jgi:glucokinase
MRSRYSIAKSTEKALIMRILAGDIGGTKTRLGLFDSDESGLHLIVEERFDSKSQPKLSDIVRQFLDKKTGEPPVAACFGIPGPVIEGFVKTANLPWELSAQTLASEIGIPKLRLVNDLAGFAAALPFLKNENLKTIHPGSEPRNKNMFAVVAPGTGLGQAYLHLEANAQQVFATEGGHIAFAPESEVEIGLLQFLQAKFRRVSIERVVCGPGLVNIYQYLKESKRYTTSKKLEDEFLEQDTAAVITQSALAHEDEICVETLRIFLRVLGGHIGDVILSTLCTGGIYLAGGIPPKIASKLGHSSFLESIWNKGRFRDLVHSTPIHLVLDDRVALKGLASLARQLR